LCTAEATALADSDDEALKALADGSQGLTLGALERNALTELFRSVFGDVPNLGLLSDRVFEVSGGNPRLSMHLAQVLVDSGKIRYEAGVWTLPSNLQTLELPSSAEEALRHQLAVLSPLARKLVETLAVAPEDTFTLEQLARVSESTESDADRAVVDLLQRQILKTSDGRYALAYASWATAANSGMSPPARAERHRAIARLLDDQPGA